MTKKILFISLILLSLAQFSFAQKAVSPAKKKLAMQLTSQTISLFPIKFFEDSFSQMNSEKAAALEKELSIAFLAKLDESNLTADEKDVAKQRVTDFTQKISEMLKSLIMKDFNVKTWTNKSLEKHYLKTFSLAELKMLNNFFKTSDGQNFVKMFNRLVTGELQGNKSGSSGADEKDFEELTKKIGNNILAKFTDSLVLKVMDDINKYVENWANQIPINVEKEMKNGAIKKEMDRFMAENFTR